MRLAVTGTGVVSPLGVGSPAFVEAVKAGRSAIGPLPEPAGVAVGARFDPAFASGIERKQAFLMDPVTEYAVAAAQEALDMAALTGVDAARIGAVIGIGVCGIETIDAAYRELYAGGGRVDPFAIPRIMPSAPASGLSMSLGIRGPAFCATSACASASHAIMTGALWLEAGLVDAVVVGGAEAPFAPGLLEAWHAMRVMADDTCRPFSLGRRGMVLGEGAGALVLERLEQAEARDAAVLGYLAGFAANADAGHIVKPDEASIVSVMRQAIEHAGLRARDVGHVNAHGTGTVLNDTIEGSAIARVFGRDAFVSGTKGATGHTLGAAGALEAIVCMHALKDQWIPPTLNGLGHDPSCGDIEVSPSTTIEASYRAALSNSFAFGGLNAVLVFAR